MHINKALLALAMGLALAAAKEADHEKTAGEQGEDAADSDPAGGVGPAESARP